jgi:hypothetical protein
MVGRLGLDQVRTVRFRPLKYFQPGGMGIIRYVDKQDPTIAAVSILAWNMEEFILVQYVRSPVQ